MALVVQPSRLSLGSLLERSRRARLWLLGVVVLTTFGCNSGGDGDSPRQLAQVKRAGESGAFRNLGKRSTSDYGSVESAEVQPDVPR